MKINNRQHITKKGVLKKNPAKKNSSNKLQTFAGVWYDKEGEFISFNLYEKENLDFEETKKNILDNFNNNHFHNLRSLYSKAGLKLHKIEYYSPNAYNYKGDSIDVVVSVADRHKLIDFIIRNKNNIQKLLSSNKSYGGYIALTSDSVQEVIEKINNDFNVDVMVITYLNSLYPLDIDEDLFYLYLWDDE